MKKFPQQCIFLQHFVTKRCSFQNFLLPLHVRLVKWCYSIQKRLVKTIAQGEPKIGIFLFLYNLQWIIISNSFLSRISAIYFKYNSGNPSCFWIFESPYMHWKQETRYPGHYSNFMCMHTRTGHEYMKLFLKGF